MADKPAKDLRQWTRSPGRSGGPLPRLNDLPINPAAGWTQCRRHGDTDTPPQPSQMPARNPQQTVKANGSHARIAARGKAKTEPRSPCNPLRGGREWLYGRGERFFAGRSRAGGRARVPPAGLSSAYAVFRAHLAPDPRSFGIGTCDRAAEVQTRALKAMSVRWRARVKTRARARPEARLRVPNPGSICGRTVRTTKFTPFCQQGERGGAGCGRSPAQYPTPPAPRTDPGHRPPRRPPRPHILRHHRLRHAAIVAACRHEGDPEDVHRFLTIFR